LPDASIKKTGFRNIVLVEIDRAPLECLRKIKQDCSFEVGRAVLVIEEVKSNYEEIKAASIRVGCSSVQVSESFCFRLNKRGAQSLEKKTPELERDIGGAIWNALKVQGGIEPRVDLRNPDITISAEMLGNTTLVGFLKKSFD
jgi:tRNA(Ser,Leu) C12 N-acetylase TAN1